MKFKSKITKILATLLLITATLIIFFIWQNNGVDITNYNYVNAKIPESFDDYTIVQVSDLHNKNYNGRLLEKIKEINPNIIVITGDLIDRRSTRIDIATEFVKQVTKIAPVYYVSGNHEQLSGKYELIKKELGNLNIQIIDNSYIALNQDGDKIGLMGIADPAIQQSEETYLWSDSSQYVRSNLEKLFMDIDTDFNILLSHRPEQFDTYKDMGVNLVFSGHAHGGQIRLPFIGGIFAPSQGLFPKYTNGIHTSKETSMVVSRGLGNSIFPLRVFNRPELVVVTLKAQ